MIAATELRLVLVTPEKTLLDRPVRSLRVPLYDGSIGIMPGRAPMVGRLGVGPMQLTDASGSTLTYFIDGGFIQVKGNVVSVLTNSALTVEKIDTGKAQSELDAALKATPTTDEEFAANQHAQARARAQLRMKR